MGDAWLCGYAIGGLVFQPKTCPTFLTCTAPATPLGVFSETGLGLAAARQMVADHGGTIAVENETGQRTTAPFGCRSVRCQRHPLRWVEANRSTANQRLGNPSLLRATRGPLLSLGALLAPECLQNALSRFLGAGAI
jgi:hypothetical protein